MSDFDALKAHLREHRIGCDYRVALNIIKRAELAEAKVARVEALELAWTDALDSGCPSCGPVGYTGCDHIEGYHHALSDLRAAMTGGPSE